MRGRTKWLRNGAALLPLLVGCGACVPYALTVEGAHYGYRRGPDERWLEAPQAAWPAYREPDRATPEQEPLRRRERDAVSSDAFEPEPPTEAVGGEYTDAIGGEDTTAATAQAAPSHEDTTATAQAAPPTTQRSSDLVEQSRAMIELATDQLIRADDERRSALDCRGWLQEHSERAAPPWRARRAFMRRGGLDSGAYRLCSGQLDARSQTEAEHKWTELLTWLEASWNAEKAARWAEYQAGASALAARSRGRAFERSAAATPDTTAAGPVPREQWQRLDDAQLNELVLRVESTWHTIYALKLRRRAAELRDDAVL